MNEKMSIPENSLITIARVVCRRTIAVASLACPTYLSRCSSNPQRLHTPPSCLSFCGAWRWYRMLFAGRVHSLRTCPLQSHCLVVVAREHQSFASNSRTCSSNSATLLHATHSQALLHRMDGCTSLGHACCSPPPLAVQAQTTGTPPTHHSPK
jgi:hypothetical protein